MKTIWPMAMVGLLHVSLPAADLVNDREVKVRSIDQVKQTRAALIRYIWSEQGFPGALLPKVATNVPTPVKGLNNVSRVDELTIRLTEGLEGLAYHFVPVKANGELVVVHHGHACTLDDDPSSQNVGYGLQRTIKALLREGYGVLGVFMPRMRPGDCGGNHDELFAKEKGSAMRFFLEPTAVSLNYLKSRSKADSFPEYKTFHMTGLSGGGWTTTVYAAIDPTIKTSYPVAGTIPLYLRTGDSIGDREQTDAGFYGIAGYPDLYVLGSVGEGRKQVQILVRKDDCCFGQAQHDTQHAGMSYTEAVQKYESQVQNAVKKVGPGSFRVEIDDSAPSHMISHHAIEDVILKELKKR
jgi:hypothetical protein